MKSNYLVVLGLILQLARPAMAESLPQPMLSWGFDRSFEDRVVDPISGSYVANVVPVRPDDRYYRFDVLNEGVWGNALYMGFRAYVETDVTVPETFTLSFWYKPALKGEATNVVAKRLAHWNRKLMLDVEEGSLRLNRQDLAPMTEPVWHHLAIVQDGASMRVWLNGDVVGESMVNPAMNTTLHLFDGGTSVGHNTGEGMGFLDEVRLYDRVLTDDQIRELARPGFYTAEARLIADAGLDQTVWSDGTEWLELKGTVEGEADRFNWRIRKQPADAEASLSAPDQASTRLQVRGQGLYELEFTARAAGDLVSRDRMTVQVFPAHRPAEGKPYTEPRHAFPGGAPVRPLAYFNFEHQENGVTASADGRYVLDFKKTKDKWGQAMIVPGAGVEGSAALRLGDGRSQEIALGSFLDGSQTVTLAVWLRPSKSTGETRLFSNQSGWQVVLGTNSRLHQICLGAGPELVLPENQWSHVVVSWDAEAARIFLNGQQVYYSPVSFGKVTRGDLMLNRAGPTHKKFFGDLDELAVYDVYLNSREVELLYEKGVKAFTTRLPQEEEWVYGYSPEFIAEHFPALAHEFRTEDFAADRISPVDPPGTHPRIYFGPSDLPDIRRRLKETQNGRSRFSALKTIVEGRLGEFFAEPDQPLPLFYAPKGMQSVAELKAGLTADDFTWQNKELTGPYTLEAFRCLIENDGEHARRLIEMLVRQAEVQQWYMAHIPEAKNANWQHPTHTLMGRRSTAIMYDLLYGWMSEAERAVVRKTIAQAVNGKWATGLDAVYGVRGHNWACWVAGDLMINAMAIEGEDGWNPGLMERCLDFYKRYLFTAVAPRDGSPFPGMAKHSVTAGKVMALSRRGVPLLAVPALYNHYRQYTLHHFQPFGGFQVVDDLLGGSLHRVWVKDLSTIFFFYPKDPVLNYVYRRATGEDFSIHDVDENAYQYTSPLVGLITADDWSGPADPDDHVEQLGLNNETSKLFNNNTFSARSGWNREASFLWFWPRMLGGHALPARGTFVFSALGREWATYDDQALSQTHPRNHSVITLDDDLPTDEWGKVIRHEETALFSSVTADLTGPYSHQQPLFLDKNWFRPASERNPYPWDDVPEALNPQWLMGNYPVVAAPLFDWEAFRRQRETWRPEGFLGAYRSATLVRGDPPYALIVDDFQKDEASHTWTWRLALNRDLGSEVVYQWNRLEIDAPALPGVSENGVYDVIVAEPGTDRRLLVRLFRCAEVPRIGLTGPVVTANPKGRGRVSNGLNRLEFTVEGPLADFAVMLYAFREGDALPSFQRDGERFIFKWPGQEDLLTLKRDPQGVSRIALDRK